MEAHYSRHEDDLYGYAAASSVFEVAALRRLK